MVTCWENGEKVLQWDVNDGESSAADTSKGEVDISVAVVVIVRAGD